MGQETPKLLKGSRRIVAGDYLVFYFDANQTIFILRIIHGKRLIKKSMFTRPEAN